MQLTPPGSACSIAIGKRDHRDAARVAGQPADGGRDADAALADLRERGVEASEVDDLAWGRFVGFADPDGNRWALQQLPDRSQG